MKTGSKRIPPKQLEKMMQDYLSYLPGWKQLQRNILGRESGPILQCIGLEALSGGSYRVVGYIHVLTAPSVVGNMELMQDLQSSGYVRPIDHQRRLEKTVEALRQELVPKITEPLDPIKVLELYEQKVIPRHYEAYSLATLNAYLGNKERAFYWSSRYTKLANEMPMPWQESTKEKRAFLDLLEKWIIEGTERQYLEEILQMERKKWGAT
jgi:hypothetical protein